VQSNNTSRKLLFEDT